MLLYVDFKRSSLNSTFLRIIRVFLSNKLLDMLFCCEKNETPAKKEDILDAISKSSIYTK